MGGADAWGVWHGGLAVRCKRLLTSQSQAHGALRHARGLPTSWGVAASPNGSPCHTAHASTPRLCHVMFQSRPTPFLVVCMRNNHIV